MKHAKRIVALLLSLVMVFALAVSASAAKITIADDPISGATYVAYKLLNAENVPQTDSQGNVTGTDNYAYSVYETYRAVLAAALRLTNTAEDPATDAEIIEAIREMNDDAEALQDFADDVYAAIKDSTPDKTASNNVFDGIDQGYYLIAETTLGTAPDGTTDTFSLVMLDTAGLDEVTVETKEDLPTVEKEVQERNDSTGENSWGDYADHDIGDDVSFRITGTVSDEYANYNSYDYQFVDTMEPGLTLNADSIVITIGNVDVTDQFTITSTDQSFTAVANLKTLTGVTVTSASTVVVNYTAELNENATRGSNWNENEVVLNYENNPYYEAEPGTGETPPPPHTPGQTPKDTAIVFTFEGDVNKVDADGDPLEGAGFTLYKWYGTNTDGSWIQVGEEIKSGSNGLLAWPGLDDGKYKLEETSVPAGYNKAEDLQFQVVARYTETEPYTLTSLTILDKNGNAIDSGADAQFSVEMTSGIFTTQIVNQTGAELPSTGSIGTTVFYALGGILVLAAIVLLVTKKRMTSAE